MIYQNVKLPENGYRAVRYENCEEGEYITLTTSVYLKNQLWPGKIKEIENFINRISKFDKKTYGEFMNYQRIKVTEIIGQGSLF